MNSAVVREYGGGGGKKEEAAEHRANYGKQKPKGQSVGGKPSGRKGESRRVKKAKKKAHQKSGRPFDPTLEGGKNRGGAEVTPPQKYDQGQQEIRRRG